MNVQKDINIKIAFIIVVKQGLVLKQCLVLAQQCGDQMSGYY